VSSTRRNDEEEVGCEWNLLVWGGKKKWRKRVESRGPQPGRKIEFSKFSHFPPWRVGEKEKISYACGKKKRKGVNANL